MLSAALLHPLILSVKIQHLYCSSKTDRPKTTLLIKCKPLKICPMPTFGGNVIDEPPGFEKSQVKVWYFREITDLFRGICRIYLKLLSKESKVHDMHNIIQIHNNVLWDRLFSSIHTVCGKLWEYSMGCYQSHRTLLWIWIMLCVFG